MIAFKTFNDCPVELRPLDIPLSYPWQQQNCEPEDTYLESYGFTIMTEEEYLAYLDSLASEFDAWVALHG